jgi:hypothetical protein
MPASNHSLFSASRRLFKTIGTLAFVLLFLSIALECQSPNKHLISRPSSPNGFARAFVVKLDRRQDEEVLNIPVEDSEPVAPFDPVVEVNPDPILSAPIDGNNNAEPTSISGDSEPSLIDTEATATPTLVVEFPTWVVTEEPSLVDTEATITPTLVVELPNWVVTEESSAVGPASTEAATVEAVGPTDVPDDNDFEVTVVETVVPAPETTTRPSPSPVPKRKAGGPKVLHKSVVIKKVKVVNKVIKNRKIVTLKHKKGAKPTDLPKQKSNKGRN